MDDEHAKSYTKEFLNIFEKLLYSQINQIKQLEEDIKELQTHLGIRKTLEEKENILRDYLKNRDSEFDPKLFVSIDDFDLYVILSTRTRNSLNNGYMGQNIPLHMQFGPIRCIGELVTKTAGQLLRIPNFGRKSLKEIETELAKIGLKLGISIPNWPPDNLESLIVKDFYEASKILHGE